MFKDLELEELLDMLNDTYYNFERFRFYLSDKEVLTIQKEIRSLKYYINKKG
jgi:hypothetical protein